MIFSVEYKAFISILYLIRGYGLREVMREFPGKGRKTFGLDNLTIKLPKMGMSQWQHGVAYCRVRVGLTSDANGYSG